MEHGCEVSHNVSRTTFQRCRESGGDTIPKESDNPPPGGSEGVKCSSSLCSLDRGGLARFVHPRL